MASRCLRVSKRQSTSSYASRRTHSATCRLGCSAKMTAQRSCRVLCSVESISPLLVCAVIRSVATVPSIAHRQAVLMSLVPVGSLHFGFATAASGPHILPCNRGLQFRPMSLLFAAWPGAELCRKRLFSDRFPGGLSEACTVEPKTISLPVHPFRQSCFGNLFQVVRSGASQIGAWCSDPVTGSYCSRNEESSRKASRRS